MKLNLSSYQKLKQENQKLLQDIYNLVKLEDQAPGIKTRLEYNIYFKIEELTFAGTATPKQPTGILNQCPPFEPPQNKPMNKLQKAIYETAKPLIPELRERVKNIKFESRYIAFPFFHGSVIDYLIFDKEANDFTKIEYSLAIGTAVQLEGMQDECYTDEVKTETFYLPGY